MHDILPGDHLYPTESSIRDGSFLRQNAGRLRFVQPAVAEPLVATIPEVAPIVISLCKDSSDEALPDGSAPAISGGGSDGASQNVADVLPDGSAPTLSDGSDGASQNVADSLPDESDCASGSVNTSESVDSAPRRGKSHLTAEWQNFLDQRVEIVNRLAASPVINPVVRKSKTAMAPSSSTATTSSSASGQPEKSKRAVPTPTYVPGDDEEMPLSPARMLDELLEESPSGYEANSSTSESDSEASGSEASVGDAPARRSLDVAVAETEGPKSKNVVVAKERKSRRLRTSAAN